MGEIMSQDEASDSLLLLCMYFDKYRNYAGYWEKIYGFSESVPEIKKSHGLCPECLQEHFPDEYVSLREEGKIGIKEQKKPGNKVLYGSFIVVNHTGCLYGGYDKEQRL